MGATVEGGGVLSGRPRRARRRWRRKVTAGFGEGLIEGRRRRRFRGVAGGRGV